MSQSSTRQRIAVAVDRFGSLKELKVRPLPLPELHADEILVRVTSAGVGVWDAYEIEGGFANFGGTKPTFPYVVGVDGAGVVEAVGKNVRRVKEGDHVYGFSSFDGRTGFYTDHAVVRSESAALLPKGLSLDTAGAMPTDAMTAFRGLHDHLHLKSGESVMVFGASGGVGHFAVQLAACMGARVFAVASGADGVSLAKRLGAHSAVDGRHDDVVAEGREFAPHGFEAALFAAGGKTAGKALALLKRAGRVAYPNGVELPKVHPPVVATGYDGTPDPAAIEGLNRLIEAGPFEVHVERTYALNSAAEAIKASAEHHLGKLALAVGL